jgi:hypothetical protein
VQGEEYFGGNDAGAEHERDHANHRFPADLSDRDP